MKKLLFFAIFIPSLVLAQLPSKNPSFTVLQQVGSAQVEFVFKNIKIDETTESFLEEKEPFYPGGKSNFIVRTNQPLLFSEIDVPAGNYIGGFQIDNYQINLTLETEEKPNQQDIEEKRLKEKYIIALTEKNFDCVLPEQSMMILPYEGGINFGNVIIMLADKKLVLNINNEDRSLIDKINKDLEKASLKDLNKYLAAAQYFIDSYQVSEKFTADFQKVVAKNPKNWEAQYTLAQCFAQQKNYENAIVYAKKSIDIMRVTKNFNAYQKNKAEDEINQNIEKWSKL